MSQAPPQVIKIDDRDPRVSYIGKWSNGGTAANYQNTTRQSETLGSSIQFAFNGTFISVYGVLGPTANNATYQLDQSAHTDSSFLAPSSPINDMPFWSSPVLPFGAHTLTITVAQEGDVFQLDYITYTGQADTADSSVSSPSQSFPDNIASSVSVSPARMSSGAIAGIAIGCFAAVLVSATCAYLFYRLRQRRTLHTVSGGLTAIDTEPPLPSPSAIGVFEKFTLPFKSHAPVSNGTQTTAVFTSVVYLTPPVSVASGPRSAASGPRSAASGPRSVA
ncbi:hypothetical protein CERSUDRAFT_116399 [Gelatoporia subvermispora B]|uniref:Uncharacterized protein n=1 Tax=Ceriporiopsis subvermispora (strain B) TaxID=914234 RepID=M2RA48_CERS8|nr:hypothetical protein CERSUDRAFT_116399 [Gelatoporia subvermispora B]